MRLFALHSCTTALDILKKILATIETDKPKELLAADWRIYNFCAAISRSYAIFEEFIKQIASEHTTWMASHCGYEAFLKNRQGLLKEGFIYISNHDSHPKYKNTPHENLLEAYHKLICKNDIESFNPELLLHHTANMRLSVIKQIYSRFGCESIDRWINNHDKLKDYLNEEFEQRSPEKFLEYFIELRNGAAHASVEDIESLANLINICTALNLICSSIDDFLASQRLQVLIDKEKAKYLGVVDNFFPMRKVISIINARAPLAIGDNLCLTSSGSTCKFDTIIDVKEHNEKDEISHTLKITNNYKKGMDIFILKP